MIPTQRVPAMTQGAQNVRCARCGHITSVPPAGGEQTRTLLLPLSPYHMHALSDTALCGADLSFRVLSDMGACCAGSDMAQLVCSRPILPGAAAVPQRGSASAVLHVQHDQQRQHGALRLSACALQQTPHSLCMAGTDCCC